MAITNSLFWLATLFAQAPAASAGDESYLAQPKFLIPVSISADKAKDLQGVLLWVSTTRGKSWELQHRIKPGEEGFQYLAKADGTYWFTVAVLDKNGNQNPRDIYAAEDRLKIIVDTVQPEVKLGAERQGSTIQVSWTIREENPDLASLKLEARIPGGEAWLPVQIRPSITGSGSLQVPQPGPVDLRMTFADKAGNKGMGEIHLDGNGNLTSSPSAPGIAPTANTLASKPAGETPGAGVLPVANPSMNNPPPLPGSGLPAASVPGNGVSGVGSVGETRIPPLPPPSGPPLAPQPSGLGGVEAPPPLPVPSSAPPSGIANNAPLGNAGVAGMTGGFRNPTSSVPVPPEMANPVLPPSAPAQGTAGQEPAVLASSSPYSAWPNPPIGQNQSRLSGGKPVQVVNKRQVRLDYEVTKAGSSGVGSVEVYMTLDDGLNWTLAATEPVSPNPLETLGNGPQRMGVMLPITQEGVIHGFTLVVKSKAGLGRPAPQRGESPQIRVELDTTHPEATLFSPVPDPNRREALILTWKATDRNITSLPVQLEWSERRDGPWHPVAEGEIPNSGRHAWLVPPHVPPSVYMRLMVKDKAGNVAIAQTAEPILVDLHVPEFQVLGIQPR